MYHTVLVFIIKNAEFVRSRLNGNLAIFLMAELSYKGRRSYPQEVGNLLYFIPLDKDAAFSVATISAHLAIKCFQNNYLK